MLNINNWPLKINQRANFFLIIIIVSLNRAEFVLNVKIFVVVVIVLICFWAPNVANICGLTVPRLLQGV